MGSYGASERHAGMAHIWRPAWGFATDLLDFAGSTPFVSRVAGHLARPSAAEDILAAGPISPSPVFGKFVSDQLFVEELLQTSTDQAEWQ
jgi:hypothetical protein